MARSGLDLFLRMPQYMPPAENPFAAVTPPSMYFMCFPFSQMIKRVRGGVFVFAPPLRKNKCPNQNAGGTSIRPAVSSIPNERFMF